MHVDDKFVHLLKLMVGRRDNETHTLVDRLKIAIRHHAGDFNNDMPIEVKTRHFEVYPYQHVVVCHKVSVTTAAHAETGVPSMESLALLVSAILLFTIMMGPISILLSRVPNPAARIFGYISGGLGIVAGVFLLMSVSSRGATLIGLLSAGLAGFGLYLNFKRRAEQRD